MRKLNNRGNNQGQGINLNETYNKLKALYAERCNCEAEQKRVWAQVSKQHCNKNAKLNELNRKIGNATHKINLILSQLCQCRKAHKIMNFAYKYISGELARTEKIAQHWSKLIQDVEHGRKVLVNGKGQMHTDTASSIEYLNKKRRQIAQLRKWQAHVARYRV